MARRAYDRNLKNHIDKGEYYWEDFLELMKENGTNRTNMLLQKALHPDMSLPEGFVRIETWQEEIGDEKIKYRAKVKYDIHYIVFIVKERYREIGWIDGAFFAKGKMDNLTDMIQADHNKEKEKEVDKALKDAASSLVRAGMYDSVEEALVAIKEKDSIQITTANGKSKAKSAEKANTAV